ncbi:unnamed protein product, partial [marine sediment metagenome]
GYESAIESSKEVISDAAIMASMGAIKYIPSTTMAGKVGQVAAGAGAFGGLTAVRGGSPEEIIVASLMGAGFQGLSLVQQQRALTKYEFELQKKATADIDMWTAEQRNIAAETFNASERSAVDLTKYQRSLRGINSGVNGKYEKAKLDIKKSMAKATQELSHGTKRTKAESKFEKAEAKAHKDIQSGDTAKMARGNRILDFLEKKKAG